MKENVKETGPRLEIDRLRLDSELVEQPALYHEWAVRSADAQRDLDQAQEDAAQVEAELNKQVRENPDEFGLAKTTESAIATAVKTQPELKAAVKKVIAAKHALQLAKAAVQGLEHRKRSLSLLVELWVRDYYSEITVSGEDNEQLAKKSVRTKGRRRLQREEDELDDHND